jgi:hypothetical protein
MTFRNVGDRLKTLLYTQNIVTLISQLRTKWIDTYTIKNEVRTLLGLNYTALFCSSVNFS